MYTVNQIRSKFLEFFKSKGHEVVSSSALVPHNDPTLMFTNAGMVPFKDVFTQNETRNYVRATSSQKCVRAGGKHNDLDNVGYTARHHTFFEMLGNFSFGDYFKEDAIKYAWEFLTVVIGLPAEKLMVTVYHTDDEAFNIWKKIVGLPDEKIIRINTNDNFWAMGDTGPCGPCSEIFYDHGDKVAGGPPSSPEQDGDRFIEIWNLVFMQYEKLASGEQINLPAPSIDTGMGLERLAAILQGKHNNYEIDLFENLITAIKSATGNNEPEKIASHRVIADHLRSVSFLLADGVMPSNEGRGYVLRRIMRRAMRHARNLGCKKPVIYQLVPALVKEMSEAYPELKRAESLITEIIKLEEEKFGETLDRGLKLLDEETAGLKSGGTLSGEIAFKLYDTYGFPYDLTVDILRGREINVDEAGFKAAMQEQKSRAKAAWKGSGDKATDEIWFEIKEAHGATEFLGYEALEAQAKVVAIVADGMLVEEISHGAEGSIILNQTPFYGESGGQEGDRGNIKTDKDFDFLLTDTKKVLGALRVHSGKVHKGKIRIGDVVSAKVNVQRRDAVRANHSATHILHAVLREVLGDHVTQKGSLVAEDKLRFDFAHPKSVSSEELAEVEHKVNAIVRQNSSVGTRVMDPESAIKAGAMALFGEKYGDEVRVVNMGLGKESDYSVELCGGTHVKATGDIGLFKITSEAAIASGIRRIEALTGQVALDYIGETEKNLAKIASLLKVATSDVLPRVEAVLEERKKLEKELATAKKAAAMGGAGNQTTEKEDINGISFIGKNFGDVSPKDLRDLIGELQQQIGSGVVAVTSSFEGKASLIIAVTDDLTAKISAVDLAKSCWEILGAKGGGGKPNFAQTGGTNGDKVADAIAKVRQTLITPPLGGV
jgi:alanyl-tRNA synthetase